MFSFAYNSSNYTTAGGSMAAGGISRADRIRNLGYDTNNRYPQFPPLMSDARSVCSSWNTESAWNADIVKRENIQSNWQYRRYLTDNAESILQTQYVASCNDTGSFTENPYKTEKMSTNSVVSDNLSIPFYYTLYTSRAKPRGYNDSDLKEVYLSREQLFARKFTPSMQSR